MLNRLRYEANALLQKGKQVRRRFPATTMRSRGVGPVKGAWEAASFEGWAS